MRTSLTPPVLRATLWAAVILLAVAPGAALGHAELDVATPADGAVVEGSPPEVAGTFTQDLDVGGSSLQLLDASGAVIAKGAPAAQDDRRMAIADLPTLPPGDYEVRWTTLSSEDDELERGTWTFTVAAAPTPSPTPVPSSTAAPSPSPSAVPSPSDAPSADPAVPPSASPAPEPGGAGSTGADVVIPIVAALAIVGVAAAVLLRRRRPNAPA